MKEVTEATFQVEVLESDIPVVVDFWAPWCGPCKVAMPKLEALDATYENVKFVKVNIEEEGELAKIYSIRALPTFLIIEEGEEVERVIADVTALETVLEGTL